MNCPEYTNLEQFLRNNKYDIIRQLDSGAFAHAYILKHKDTDTKAMEKELSIALGLRVLIEHSASGENGSIILKYKTLEEFDRVRDLLIGEDWLSKKYPRSAC